MKHSTSKPVRLGAFVAVVGLLTLSACGGDDDDTPAAEPTADTEITEPTQTTAAPEETETTEPTADTDSTEPPQTTAAPEDSDVELEAVTLTIPVAVQNSGPLATYSESMVNGYLLAADEINAAGGVVVGDARYEFEFDFIDDGGDAANGAAIVRQVVSDGDPILMGFPASAVLSAAAPIAAESPEDLLLFPVGTLNGLTELGENIFRNRQPTGTPQHADAMFDVINDLAPESLGIFLNESNPVYVALADQVSELASDAGISITGTQRFSTGTTDFAPLVTNMRADNPTAVLIVGNPPADIAGILNEMQLQGLDAVGITNDASLQQLMIDSAADGALNGLNSVAVPTNEVIAELGGDFSSSFFERYEAEFGISSGTYSPSAYDDLHILAAAMAQAGSLEVPALIAAMSELSVDDVTLVESTVISQDGLLFNDIRQVVRPYAHFVYGEDDGIPVFIGLIEPQ